MDEDDDSITAETANPAPILPPPPPTTARTLGGGNTLSGAAPPTFPSTWGTTTSSGSASASLLTTNQQLIQYIHSSSSRSATPSNPMRSNEAPRVSTLRDLNSSAPAQQRPDSDDDDDDDNKEQLEFFTGGEKRSASPLQLHSSKLIPFVRSGLSVENPNARRGNGGMGDMIKGILQKAKEYVESQLHSHSC